MERKEKVEVPPIGTCNQLRCYAMLGITGYHSSIPVAYLKLDYPKPEFIAERIDNLPFDCDEYLLCGGVLHGKSVTEISDGELIQTFIVNFSSIAKFCDYLFSVNNKAKVCIIGSESGVKGSYDMAYAGAKAALHLYVETKKLNSPDQNLVCVSPTIIEDSGMTQRRDDLREVLKRGRRRRMGRWLKAEEVARIAHFALHEVALANTVIHVNGGCW